MRDVDPTIVHDIRYAGSHNFVGRPIAGYRAAECILSASAANALKAVQGILAEQKLSLIVWDCYRPKRAVEDFFRWSKDPTHSEMKAEFYPRTDKEKLFALGYLAKRSAHSRGSTVDLGIVPTASSFVPMPMRYRPKTVRVRTNCAMIITAIAIRKEGEMPNATGLDRKSNASPI